MVEVKVRQKYQGLSRQELLNKAHELGFNFERNSQSCSQCTVAALHELLEIEDVVVKVASSSAGGQLGQVTGTCGGLIGGTMVLDYFFGRPADKMSHEEGIPGNVRLHVDALKVATPLFYRFIKEYGTILCPQIQLGLFGRHYYFLDKNEMAKFEEAGGHEDKCTNVVGYAAQWVVEILLNKGAIKL
ncbi:MAG: C_GCAxxG_C_C family protein [Dehalococcoidales bacterium]|nr:C_GCAxxG_C_C family protein [Dehalococcoidales bacterium]